MNFGEDIIHEGAGLVVGNDTGRVIAKFSHEAEADSFCESFNCKAPTDNGIVQLDGLCKKYNDGEINICELVCRVWNGAVAL